MRVLALALLTLTLFACGDPTGTDEITPELVEIFERMAQQDFTSLEGKIEVSTLKTDGANNTEFFDPVNIDIALMAPANYHCEAFATGGVVGSITNSDSVVRRDTRNHEEMYFSPATGSWSEVDRAALERIAVRECTVLIALFGIVPPYEDLLALPTPRGEDAVTITRGVREIQGRLCDAVEIRNVFQNNNYTQRYMVEAESGMLMELEVDIRPIDHPNIVTSVVERFMELRIDEPIDPNRFETTDPLGIPARALFREGSESRELATLLANARLSGETTASLSVESRRWRRQGSDDEIAIEMDFPTANDFTLVATDPHWASPSTLSIVEGNATLESQFPSSGAAISGIDDLTCETFNELGLSHTPLMNALFGLECEPLASWMANADTAQLIETVEVMERTENIYRVTTEYSTGSPVTLLLGVDADTGLIHQIEAYTANAEGEMQRVLAERVTALEPR